MKNRGEWTNFEHNDQPRGIEAELKYGIEYPWGALHVTDKAYKSYNLVPLVEGVRYGGGIELNTPKDINMRTDIYLMDPTEFMEHFENKTIPNNLHIIEEIDKDASSIAFHDGGMEIYLALFSSTEEASNYVKENLREDAEMYDLPVNDDEIDDIIDDIVERDKSQLILEYICVLVNDSIENSAIEYFRAKNSEKTLKIFNNAGLVGLLGSVALLGTGLIDDGKISTKEALITMGFMASSEFIRRNRMEVLFRSSNDRENKIGVINADYADLITNDIYETFSFEHFDKNAEAIFNQS